MKLAELQTRFQAGIVKGDNTILASIADSRKTDRATLFAVYHDAYRLRLAEFLSTDFPVLRVHLGDEAFERLVRGYIESAPSRQPNARWYGTRLPDFMQKTAPWRRNRGAIDLARFERALLDAFDAPDAPVSTIDALRDTSVKTGRASPSNSIRALGFSISPAGPRESMRLSPRKKRLRPSSKARKRSSFGATMASRFIACSRKTNVWR